MLEVVKQALRIRSDSLNDEVLELIESAKLDMSVAGVKKIDTNDKLIRRAIIIYCKANHGLDNKDSEKYQKSYDILIQRLALCGDYNVE